MRFRAAGRGKGRSPHRPGGAQARTQKALFRKVSSSPRVPFGGSDLVVGNCYEFAETTAGGGRMEETGTKLREAGLGSPIEINPIKCNTYSVSNAGWLTVAMCATEHSWQ